MIATETHLRLKHRRRLSPWVRNCSMKAVHLRADRVAQQTLRVQFRVALNGFDGWSSWRSYLTLNDTEHLVPTRNIDANKIPKIAIIVSAIIEVFEIKENVIKVRIEERRAGHESERRVR